MLEFSFTNCYSFCRQRQLMQIHILLQEKLVAVAVDSLHRWQQWTQGGGPSHCHSTLHHQRGLTAAGPCMHCVSAHSKLAWWYMCANKTLNDTRCTTHHWPLSWQLLGQPCCLAGTQGINPSSQVAVSVPGKQLCHNYTTNQKRMNISQISILPKVAVSFYLSPYYICIYVHTPQNMVFYRTDNVGWYFTVQLSSFSMHFLYQDSEVLTAC